MGPNRGERVVQHMAVEDDSIREGPQNLSPGRKGSLIYWTVIMSNKGGKKGECQKKKTERSEKEEKGAEFGALFSVERTE